MADGENAAPVDYRKAADMRQIRYHVAPFDRGQAVLPQHPAAGGLQGHQFAGGIGDHHHVPADGGAGAAEDAG